MSLREQAVEAIADQTCFYGAPSCGPHLSQAEAALDALLLFLTEHTDLVADASDPYEREQWLPDPIEKYLIIPVAALRGTTEESVE